MIARALSLLILASLLIACAGGSDEGSNGAADAAASDGDPFALDDATDAPLGDAPVDTAIPVPPAIAALCTKKVDMTVPGTNRCVGDLARATFLFGMCSCTNFTMAGGGLNLSGTSSKTGMSATAALGVNGRVTNYTGIVEGDVLVAGRGVASGTTAADAYNMVVNGNVRVQGGLNGGAVVQKDAYVAGALTTGPITIQGKLHQPAGFTNSDSVVVVGGIVNEPVTVPEPCDCSRPLPIPSYVAVVKDANDNAALGLTPTSLRDRTGTVDLGCGRFYFDSISGSPLTVRVFGPTAVYVAGDLTGKVVFQVVSGGQLDLFVQGNVSLQSSGPFGASSAPANARIYVHGSSFAIDNGLVISANLYMPNAALAVGETGLAIYGALLARDVTLGKSSMNMVYDQSVQELTGCQPPGGACNNCHDCPGATPACKGGTCTKCTSDSDCCAPLRCNSDGICRSEIK